MRRPLALMAACFLVPASAQAAPVAVTAHGPSHTSLDGMIAVGDVLSGLIPTELPGDQGWHPANPAAANGSLDPNGLPTFTNDAGGAGLAGLLNDFPGVGSAAKLIRYDLPQPTNLSKIQILTGNEGKDGRVFSTTFIRYSTDQGVNYQPLGYFQSDPSGTVNAGEWGSTLVEITEEQGGWLIPGATNLIFEMYAVDNTGGQMRDPFDGVNGFTGVDDGLSAAFVSPLVWEIDAVGQVVPEPLAGAMAGVAVVFAALRRRRTALTTA